MIGMDQSVWRRATAWKTGVRFLAAYKMFSLPHSVKTGSGAKLISYSIGTGASFTGDKEALA
jgi:hypothetical protein